MTMNVAGRRCLPAGELIHRLPEVSDPAGSPWTGPADGTAGRSAEARSSL
ncbi:hypothetical protein [Streptomyces sp. NPDC088258]